MSEATPVLHFTREELAARRIADRRGRDAADRRLGVAVMMHVGIVQHDLAPAA